MMRSASARERAIAFQPTPASRPDCRQHGIGVLAFARGYHHGIHLRTGITSDGRWHKKGIYFVGQGLCVIEDQVGNCQKADGRVLRRQLRPQRSDPTRSDNAIPSSFLFIVSNLSGALPPTFFGAALSPWLP